ncbi:DUF3068 domain-containing protein [Micromonospora sp. DT47]|uniref:DUF3068 domain-containing protein n=1 Tax=Micromonospora sp. DT47 TaxID=3393431 RepID=UPI003CF9B7F9
MKHRAIGTVLFGLGALLLVFAAGLAFVVAPAVTKLPYDLERSVSVVEAPGARFLQIKKIGDNVEIKTHQATLRSTVAVQPNAKATADLTGDLDSTAVVWTVGQTVERTDLKEQVSAYAAELAIDRVSGEGLFWNGQWLDEAEERAAVLFEGQVYKFPFNTEKKEYRIYDRDVRKALPARYIGTETVDGVEVYRFEQVIDDQELRMDDGRVAALLGSFAPGATEGKVVYSNTRTVWVEPLTGSYLKVQEVQRKALVPNSGLGTVLLDATFDSTPETVAAAVERARESRQQLQTVRLYGPITLTILGVASIIGGLLVARRRADPSPSPRHSSGDDSMEGRGGPLTDELPPASQNWRSDDTTAPIQRSAPDEAERR